MSWCDDRPTILHSYPLNCKKKTNVLGLIKTITPQKNHISNYRENLVSMLTTLSQRLKDKTSITVSVHVCEGHRCSFCRQDFNL